MLLFIEAAGCIEFRYINKYIYISIPRYICLFSDIKINYYIKTIYSRENKMQYLL
jgi:hypothetical protein